MSIAKQIYDIFLTPRRALFLHLVFLGIPFRFGLWPTGWARNWLPPIFPDYVLPLPCAMFDDKLDCSEEEQFAISDFGVRILQQTIITWVVWYTMRTTHATINAFHKTLLFLTGTSLLYLTWLQYFFYPNAGVTDHEFYTGFFKNLVTFHLLAIALSGWTLLAYPHIRVGEMKWSIPANSIFCGAVFNIFLATASFQALMDRNGVDQFYKDKTTPVMRVCFGMAAMQTAVHAVLLLRIRYFMTIQQLKAICLYKVILNIALPFFWFPELSPIFHVDARITIAIRVSSTITYFMGYWWAGSAEGVSRILSGEKED